MRNRVPTILLVDDEQALRAMLAVVLRNHGFEVLEAGSAKEALQVCSQSRKRLQLVITDVEMPGMRGPDLVAELSKSCCSPPVLYISGFYAEESFRKRVAAHTVNFLQKPFAPDVLLARVKELL